MGVAASKPVGVPVVDFVDRAGHADAPPEMTPFASLFSPTGRGNRLFDGFCQTAATDLPAMDRHITRTGRIPESQLRWIHTQLLGDHVELGIEGEGVLGIPVTPVSPHRTLVGINQLCVGSNGGDPVYRVVSVGANDDHSRSHVAIRPGLVKEIQFPTEYGPVSPDGRFHIVAASIARAACKVLFLSRIDHLDRPPGLLAQNGCGRIECIEHHLAAERPPGVTLDHADAPNRDLQHPGEHDLNTGSVHRPRVDGDLAGHIPFNHAGVRFGIALMDPMGIETVLSYQIGFCQGPVHFTFVDPDAHPNVVGSILVDLRRTLLDRFLRVENGRKVLVLYDNALQTLHSSIFIRGGYRSDFIPLIADSSVSEDGHVRPPITEPVNHRRHVLRCDDSLDARYLHGVRGVQMKDAGVMPGTPQHFADEHPRQDQIGSVFGPPRYLGDGVWTPDSLAKDIEFSHGALSLSNSGRNLFGGFVEPRPGEPR